MNRSEGERRVPLDTARRVLEIESRAIQDLAQRLDHRFFAPEFGVERHGVDPAAAERRSGGGQIDLAVLGRDAER